MVKALQSGQSSRADAREQCVAAPTEQRRTSLGSFTSIIMRSHREAALGLSAGRFSHCPVG